MDDVERRVVYSQDEVNDFFYYQSVEAPEPKFFPCIMYREHLTGGLGGDYFYHGFEYPPEGVDFPSWAAGKGVRVRPTAAAYKGREEMGKPLHYMPDYVPGWKVRLHDAATDEGYTAKPWVHVRPSGSGIEIDIEGCGLKTMESGKGQVIYIEVFRGSPRLLVWSDINSEDPTHVIDLADALENRRGDSDD